MNKQPNADASSENARISDNEKVQKLSNLKSNKIILSANILIFNKTKK